jgi:hypothetical protein
MTLHRIDHTLTGATIGAARLDNLFESAVLERLELADSELPMGLCDLSQTAWEMRISKEYQKWVVWICPCLAPC